MTPREFGNVSSRSASPKPGGLVASSVPAIEGRSSCEGKTDTLTLRGLLQRAELFKDALLATISDLVFEVRKDGLILSFHAPPENEFLLTPDGVAGKRLMELLPTQLAQLAMHYVEKTCRTGTMQKFSCQYLLPGRLRFFEARLALGGSGDVIVVVRDVTDRETLEKEVVESSNRVQMRIGQDIHDGLGQHLTGISFLSRALEKNLAAKGLVEAAEAAEISKLVIEALSQTRNLARGLFPVEVESDSLSPSLKDLARTVEQLFNISCIVECEEGVVVKDRVASTHLFRLAQEAVNNAVKHGKANRVTIRLQRLDGRLILGIVDDGIGLPKDGIKRSGLGLRIMTYRAQKVGGSLEITAGECGGTAVSCTFNPINDEN
ncbi:MAG: two-component system, LuxR family, sensor kinase FixL [Verrucomicrobiota bacterium]|jgi:signal transduction histidine kinase